MDDSVVAEKPESETPNKDQAACYSYEGDVCIYTDQATGFQYRWDKENNKWVPKNEEPEPRKTAELANEISTENENRTTDSENPASIPGKYKYNGKTYFYTDEKSGIDYEWDLAKNKWKIISGSKQKLADEEEVDSDASDNETVKAQEMKGVYDIRDGIRIYTDPNDGTVYEWDEEKRAWFPKLDDEFLARYQLGYGVENPSQPPVVKEEPKVVDKPSAVEAEPTKKPPKEPSWFEIDDAHNTKVYVSNLPLDMDEEEFVELMQKYGFVAKDLDSGKLKIKMYKDDNGHFKGDALCTYLKVESVDLVLNILDGSDVRGKTVRAERAKFTMKGTYDPTRKPRKRRKKDLEKIKRKQEKLLDWRPDKLRGERARNENVVILKRLFAPADFDKNPSLLLEYQKELRETCSKYGRVRKIIIHDRHEEGVAQVFFKSAEEADTCVNLLHGCWFRGHKVFAETWDGVTKYKSTETEADREARLAQWAKYLEQDEEDDNAK